jgi:hypothetical protein
MAWTIEQLNALDAAIAEGALTVKYADKSVTYRSLDEMLRIRALIVAALNPDPLNTGGIVYPSYGKGYCVP